MNNSRLRLFALALLIAFVGAIALMGCGGAATEPDEPSEEPGEEPSEDEPSEEPSEEPAEDDKSGGSISYGVNKEGDMLDPHVGSSRYDYAMFANIYDSLLYWDPDDQVPVPWLAESVEANDDYTKFTITLREDVTFHDGTPLNAEAVKFNFDRIVDPDTESAAAAGDMPGYVGTTVVDDFVAEVEFSSPNAIFEEALCGRVGMMNSPTAIEEKGHEDFIIAPVGTGPFMFVEWVERDRVVLERNPDYAWPNPDSTNDGPAYLDEVIYRFIPEDTARSTALERGEIDGTMRLPFQDVEKFEGDTNFQTRTDVLPGTGVMLVVNASRPPLDDIRVRQALQHLNDGEMISEVGYFGVSPAHDGSILSPPNASFVDLSDMYDFNVDKADELLDEAGWDEKDDDGIRMKDGEKLEIKYIGFTSEQTQRIMEYVQSEYLKAGIDLEIELTDGPAIQKARQEGEHDICHLTWICNENFLRALFHSENIGDGWNFTHTPDSTLDSMLEDADATLDWDERLEKYGEIQRYILEEAMIVPTVYQVNTVGLRSGIEGFRKESMSVEPPYFQETWLSE